MGDYTATVAWARAGAEFSGGRYSRAHVWEFDGGVKVPASASPQVVRAPFSVADAVDPEEAFVASLASCHMLWFLSIAASRGFVVDDYRDKAHGVMAKDGSGRLAITTVGLHPEVAFGGTRRPTQGEHRAMHDEAHEQCFIANSVKTAVRCDPVDVSA